MPEKLTYNIPEVAAVLGISTGQAYVLAHTPGFPVIHLGERRLVVPVEALRRWLDKQTAAALDGAC